VRVFVGGARAAVVGYWCDGGGYALVDPTRTATNAFALAPALVALPEAGAEVAVRKGMLVEVLAKRIWQAAVIVAVQPGVDLATVAFLKNGRRQHIALRSHTWRRLARGNDTDVDAAVRSLIAQAREARAAHT